MNEGYLDISEGGSLADEMPTVIHGAGEGIEGAGEVMHGAGGGISNGFTGV